MPDPIRILLVDDHVDFLAGLHAVLASVPDFEVVGEAADGRRGVEAALVLQPDVVLMDLQMPGMNGVDATRQIVYTSPHIGVIMLTMFEDDNSVFAAMRAGARGYLLKGAPKAEILHAVRGVAAGEAIFGSGLARRMINYFAAVRPRSPADSLPELTDRELEILELLTHHLTNQEIADRLAISLKTARNHVSNILSKLQVADRAAAIMRAREAGM